MKAREKIEEAARRFVEGTPTPLDGDMVEYLTAFGKEIRRQTLREERSRNKRVAKMFKPIEPIEPKENE